MSSHHSTTLDHLQLHLSNHEVNFLVYLGWKTLGWALMFLGILLVLRCLKLWLIHACFLPHTECGLSLAELERARAWALREIHSRRHEVTILDNETMRNQRRNERHRRCRPPAMEGIEEEEEENLDDIYSEILDPPPNYEDVVMSPQSVGAQVGSCLTGSKTDCFPQKQKCKNQGFCCCHDLTPEHLNKDDEMLNIEEELPPDYFSTLTIENETAEEAVARNTETCRLNIPYNAHDRDRV